MARPDTPAGAMDTSVAYIHWGPVIAGALAASALSFVLFTFGSGLGLAIASPTPSWRDGSVVLAILSGLYVILTTLASFGLGGYVAGRLRSRWGSALTSDETDFRDGVHGLLVWALAVAMGALLAMAAAATVGAGSAAAASVPSTTTGEPIIAYDLDRLFRSERAPPAAADMSYSRAEASRIALAASGRRGLLADDRAQLVRIVTTRTGTAGPEAERRVDEFVGNATTAIKKARRSAIVVAFMTAAGLLLGAAAAWFAAALGGRHRDETPPSLVWGPSAFARLRTRT
jgi:hypothetical protein